MRVEASEEKRGMNLDAWRRVVFERVTGDSSWQEEARKSVLRKKEEKKGVWEIGSGHPHGEWEGFSELISKEKTREYFVWAPRL